ncbi:MAG: 4Fe-4S dicluster domain-containing protein [Myxococcota bacterium]
MIRIRGGHCFRLKGEPRLEVIDAPRPGCVALCPRGFTLKPRIVVKVGQSVAAGQELLHDKVLPMVKWTSPAGGTVEEIRLGQRRALQAIVIRLPQDPADEQSVDFGAVTAKQAARLDVGDVVNRLLAAGLWPVLRRFPGDGLAPVPQSSDLASMQALYVSAVPGEPHSPRPTLVLAGCHEWFALGLRILSRLVPRTYVFSTPSVPLPLGQMDLSDRVRHCVMQERTPAHHVGVQRYVTEGPWPTGRTGCVAGVDVEGVIQVGHLFATGRPRTDRLYAIGGEAMPTQLHVKGRVGMCVRDLLGAAAMGGGNGDTNRRDAINRVSTMARGEDDGVENPIPGTRLIAGGLLTGRGVGTDDFLGFADHALQGLVEDRSRPLLAFLRLGMDKLTLSRAWGAALHPTARRGATASAHGEERACIQCGACLRVCPTELMPNLLFKAALAQDIERMERYSIQDCVDCGLCTFVCPSKIELGRHIASGKRLIAREG